MGNHKSKQLLQPPPRKILHTWTIDDKRAKNTLFVRTEELKSYKKVLNNYCCSARYSNYQYADYLFSGYSYRKEIRNIGTKFHQSKNTVQHHIKISNLNEWCFIGIRKYDLEQLITGTGIELEVVGEMSQQFYIG